MPGFWFGNASWRRKEVPELENVFYAILSFFKVFILFSFDDFEVLGLAIMFLKHDSGTAIYFRRYCTNRLSGTVGGYGTVPLKKKNLLNPKYLWSIISLFMNLVRAFLTTKSNVVVSK